MDYNQMIDHTLLKAEATQAQIDKLLKEAIEYKFKTVCVNSSYIAYCKKALKGSGVEAAEAIKAGADEIDMVIEIGKLKDKDYDYVLNDIKEVKKACGKHTLKVIVETALLTEDEIEEITKIVMKSGAEFIKTSTGFSTRGANLNDVKIMKSVCGDKLLIKAAGGISNYDDMVAMAKAGANRFGTSRSVSIITGKTDGSKGSY